MKKDWLIQDSIQYSLKKGTQTHFWCSKYTCNALKSNGESYEYFDQDTISLSTDGLLQLYQVKIEFNQEWKDLHLDTFLRFYRKGRRDI